MENWVALTKEHYCQRALQEWELLLKKKYTLIAGVLITYLHSVASNLVYYNLEYFHVSQDDPVLEDMGFKLIPQLDRGEYGWISELITFAMIGFTISWALVSVFQPQPRTLYAVNLINRFLISTSIALIGRSLAFNMTLLPSPAEHCRPTSEDYAPPVSIAAIFLRVDASQGCGDLIFSSHTTYVLHCVLTYWTYGSLKIVKGILIMGLLALGYLIVALRNHYTVDVWLAWFIVPFIWDFVWNHMPDEEELGGKDKDKDTRISLSQPEP